MKYSLVRKVAPPKKANKIDAGIDFFVPTDLTGKNMMSINFFDGVSPERGSINQFESSPNDINVFFNVDVNDIVKSIIVKPRGRVLIPSGVRADVPPQTALIFMNKSGVATKKGIVVGACVVDHGYQGEMHISLINTSESIIEIKANDKIVQGVLVPIVDCGELTQVDDKMLFENKSDRGAGGFGSSGATAN